MSAKSARFTKSEEARNLLAKEFAAQCRHASKTARKLRIPESTLRAKLAGTRTMDLVTATRLATELGIPASIVSDWEAPEEMAAAS